METTEVKLRIKDYVRDIDSKAERRFTVHPIIFAEIETNGAKAVDENIIEGYGSVFNSDSDDFGGWVERVSPGAFDDVMGDEAFGLFNHSMNLVLGRNKVNMELTVDDKGLKYRIKLPDTTVAQDVRKLVKAGIITRSSYAFTVKEERFVKPDKKGDPYVRWIDKIARLYDVSPVTMAAFPDTTVSARSLKRVEAEFQITKGIKEARGFMRLKINTYKNRFQNSTN